MGKAAESRLVFGAPTLTHHHGEDEYIDAISNTPRNGKVTCNMANGNEREVLHPIKSMDAWTKSYAENRQSASTLSLGNTRPPAHRFNGYEPYVNPFTGRRVTPDRPDKPGSSCRIHDTPFALCGGQLITVEETCRPFDAVSCYPKPPLSTESPEHHSINRSPQSLHPRPSNPTPATTLNDTLWETFGGEQLSSLNPGVAVNANTRKSKSLGSKSAGSPLNEPSPFESRSQASLDGKGIERSLQGSEKESGSRGWDGPLTNRDAAEHYMRSMVMPEVRRGHRPEQNRQNQFEQDRKCAMDLTGPNRQNSRELLEAEISLSSEERQRMQAIQDEIDRRHQEEMKALFEPIRRLQDRWDSEADEVIGQDQEERKAKEKTQKEMSRLQAQMQAEHDRQFEEDLLLARALFDIENEAAASPDWHVHRLSTWSEQSLRSETSTSLTRVEAKASLVLPRRENRGTASFRRLKKALGLAINQLPASMPVGIFKFRQNTLTPTNPDSIRPSPPRDATQGKRAGPLRSSDGPGCVREDPGNQGPPASDQDTISASMIMAGNLQKTWSQETHLIGSAARNAREEGGRKERQAVRGMKHHRREEGQRRRTEQRGREERERMRSARTAECSACVELVPKRQMCRLGCKHFYCQPCLDTAIQLAVKDKTIFQCCGQRIEPDDLSLWLPASVRSAYADVVEELATPDPTYCHSWRCSAFIPRAHYVGDTARCPRCSNETCRLCKRKVHAGMVCEQDAAGQALLGLSQTRKWMRCPHCKTMVERSAGCLHMTCRCGTQFCYNCGKPRWRCRGNKCTRR